MTDLAEESAEEAPVSRRRWPVAGGVLSLVLVVLALVGMMAASDDDGGGANEASPGADSADAGFARDMAVHHQQAVEMSFIIRDRTDDEEVRNLAYDIINTQANQRGMLLGLLSAWELPVSSADPYMAWMGHAREYEPRDGSLMPGMATNTQIEELRAAEGRPAEVRYLQLLTDHHRAGVDMAEAAADLAEDPVIVRLAESTVRGQRSEIELMAGMLDDRGANEPAQDSGQAGMPDGMQH